jgi:SAM-dependent methyltransferase
LAHPTDLYTKYFERCHLPIAGRARIWKAIVGYLERRYIPSESAVLELGAGYCDFINQIHAKERYALDQSEIIKVHAAPGVRTLVQSCTDLSNLPAEHFDVVFASNLFEHLVLSVAGETLDEIRKVLKPGGLIILMQPNFAYAYRNYFDDVSHVQIFTHVSLADLLKLHDFSIKDVRAKFLPLSIRGTRLPTLPWLVTVYLHSPIKPFAGQMLLVGQR